MESQLTKLEALQERAIEADETATELTALRQERDQVRTRVADLLEQIEALEV